MNPLASLWIVTGICLAVSIVWFVFMQSADRRGSIALGYVWLLWTGLSYVLLCVSFEASVSVATADEDIPFIARHIGVGLYYMICPFVGWWLWRTFAYTKG